MALTPTLIQELLLNTGGRYAVRTLEEAQSFCNRLASEHYENFPVASMVLRAEHRKHVSAIYAFARLADDVADEDAISRDDVEEQLQTLIQRICSPDVSTNPIVIATRAAMHRYKISRVLLERLVAAFIRDAHFTQPSRWDDVYAYCHNSANPVGEILLRIHGEDNEQNIRYSNHVCTALQLINFWQDQSRDHARGRCYIPQRELEHHGCEYRDGSIICENEVKHNALYVSMYTKTRKEMFAGLPLLRRVGNLRLRIELCLICASAMQILAACEKAGSAVQHKRPALRKKDMMQVILRALRYALSRHSSTP